MLKLETCALSLCWLLRASNCWFVKTYQPRSINNVTKPTTGGFLKISATINRLRRRVLPLFALTGRAQYCSLLLMEHLTMKRTVRRAAVLLRRSAPAAMAVMLSKVSSAHWCRRRCSLKLSRLENKQIQQDRRQACRGQPIDKGRTILDGLS